MLDLTFLDENDLDKIDVLKEYGKKCKLTDFAILLGADMFDKNNNYYGDKHDQPNGTGFWWTKKCFSDNLAFMIDPNGFQAIRNVTVRTVGGRPVFKHSNLGDLAQKGTNAKKIVYGEYPQMIADSLTSKELEKLYCDNNLSVTGKEYSTDFLSEKDGFNERKHIEYRYDGNKYIRIIGDGSSEGKKLSNRWIVKSDKPYWIKVSPIVWLLDEKADIVISEYILFAGVQYFEKSVNTFPFENSNIKRFMDTYLEKDICNHKVKYLTGKEATKKYEEIDNYVLIDKKVDIDQLFEDVINKMNEINEVERPKTMVLK